MCEFCAVSYYKLNGGVGDKKDSFADVYVYFDTRQIVVVNTEDERRFEILCCPFCGRKL